MSICLATTWFPRGEFPRFTRMLPLLEENYAWIVISYLPNDDPRNVDRFISGEISSHSRVVFFGNDDPKTGRYLAVKKALETTADFIHYTDMDRLLHWVETNPEEWKRSLEKIAHSDCVIFGRTAAALMTHPEALTRTEQISNRVVSNFLNEEMDVSAGSKSFSRSAAQYLVDHCRPDNSIGTDAEWPISLKKAGFRLHYVPVEGLDWESADHFLPQAANRAEQAQAAKAYDADPEHWSRRVDIADEIIRSAIEAAQSEISSAELASAHPAEFDLSAVFEVDDYLYFYSEALTDERTETEVSALVSMLELSQPMKILDLACGFGRHTNRLAALGHQMTGVDITPGFLEIARKDAAQKGVDVLYLQGDMRTLTFEREFDRVLLVFTAFGYFSDDENLQVLINIRNALLPGGLLIFDSNNRDTLLKNMQPFLVVEKEGNLMIDRMSFDSQQGRLYNRRIVFRGGIRKDKPYFVRLYNPSEIRVLTTQAGLELEHLYGDWKGNALSADSRRLIVIARRPA